MKKFSVIIASFIVAVLAVSSVNFRTMAAVPGNNTLVTMKHDNTEARSLATPGFNPNNSTINSGDMSRDGSAATFITTSADNALANPVATNQAVVRNLQTNTNELGSRSASGAEANQAVLLPYLSETGQFLIFSTTATNLDPSVTTPTYQQVYIRDRIANTVAVASKDSSGVAGNGDSIPFAVSNDGRFVLFQTTASNLGANINVAQLIRKDMVTGNVQIVSKSEQGVLASTGATDRINVSMSCDGAFVAFASNASNLVPNDIDNAKDIFLADLRSGHNISNISDYFSGGQFLHMGDLSCNGRYIAFDTSAIGVTPETVTGSYRHAFMYDRLEKTMVVLDKNYYNGAVNPDNTRYPAVSDYGHVVFTSEQNSLVQGYGSQGKAHTYIRDTKTGITQILSVTSSGAQDNNGTVMPNMITSDGKKAMYLTPSTNLSATTDTNGNNDFYISQTGY